MAWPNVRPHVCSKFMFRFRILCNRGDYWCIIQDKLQRGINSDREEFWEKSCAAPLLAKNCLVLILGQTVFKVNNLHGLQSNISPHHCYHGDNIQSSPPIRSRLLLRVCPSTLLSTPTNCLQSESSCSVRSITTDR